MESFLAMWKVFYSFLQTHSSKLPLLIAIVSAGAAAISAYYAGSGLRDNTESKRPFLIFSDKRCVYSETDNKIKLIKVTNVGARALNNIKIECYYLPAIADPSPTKLFSYAQMSAIGPGLEYDFWPSDYQKKRTISRGDVSVFIVKYVDTGTGKMYCQAFVRIWVKMVHIETKKELVNLNLSGIDENGLKKVMAILKEQFKKSIYDECLKNLS